MQSSRRFIGARLSTNGRTRHCDGSPFIVLAAFVVVSARMAGQGIATSSCDGRRRPCPLPTCLSTNGRTRHCDSRPAGPASSSWRSDLVSARMAGQGIATFSPMSPSIGTIVGLSTNGRTRHCDFQLNRVCAVSPQGVSQHEWPDKALRLRIYSSPP